MLCGHKLWTVPAFSWITWCCFHLFTIEFSQDPIIYPCKLPASFVLIPTHRNGIFLGLDSMNVENQLAFLDPSSLQDYMPWCSSKQIPEQVKVCSPEFQGCVPAVCLVSFSQDPELHHLTFTAGGNEPLPFTSLTSSSLLVCIRYSRASSPSAPW